MLRSGGNTWLGPSSGTASAAHPRPDGLSTHEEASDARNRLFNTDFHGHPRVFNARRPTDPPPPRPSLFHLSHILFTKCGGVACL
mmetsp:Transcript_68656/g.183254  ORF Transcript_68656/g.183254 Transcript_68656/m.183254 type:complete len:85 (-) Transcript_68656:22-276(-)